MSDLKSSSRPLEVVHEIQELPPDLNYKVFGGRYRPVTVKLEFIKNVKQLLTDLSEFIYKNANLIDFSGEAADCWLSIFKAVLNSQCAEHKVFKQNLNKLIEQNIKELGYDP